MKYKLLSVLLAVLMVVLPVHAQRVIGGGGCGIDPPPPPPPPPPPVTCPTSINSGSTAINTAWGFYNWQVDLKPNTTTLASETDFRTNPGGLVNIAIPTTGSLPCTVTVHEIHGTVALEAQVGGSCGVNSMVAQVLDQNGNALAAASLIEFGPANTNVPIKGTLSTPLTVTSFSLQISLSPGCSSVLSWDLVMS